MRLGHTVDLVTYPFGESPDLEGLTIHRTVRPLAVKDVGIGPSLAKCVLDIPLFLKAHRLALSGCFDLVHTHEEAGVLGSWISRRTGILHLYDMHSSLPQQFANFGRYNWAPVVTAFRRLERYTMEASNGVIAICPELREHVIASGYRGPLALIENTLDFEVPPVGEEELQALRMHLGVEGLRVVLYTGTLEAYQGLDLLLAAARVVARHVPDVRFVIVGGTDDQGAKLKRQAEGLGIADAFVFVSAVSPTDVFRYHRIADVLVSTRSKGTNTPLKIYQYLRAGKPIVATAIHSHTQVLNHGSAELVKPTAEDIADGLVRVLNDAQRGRGLAEEAARMAREVYSEEVYMNRLRGLLDEILARGNKTRAA